VVLVDDLDRLSGQKKEIVKECLLKAPIFVVSARLYQSIPESLRLTIEQKGFVLLYWALATLAGFFLILSFENLLFYHLFWFACGGLLHLLADALTPAGIPLSPRSTYRVTLFGGRIRTALVRSFCLEQPCSFFLSFGSQSWESSSQGPVVLFSLARQVV